MPVLRVRCLGAILAGVCLALTAAVWAQEKDGQEKGEKKLEMKDLPKAVRQAIQKETQGATIVGLSTEAEQGKTIYEVETKVIGHGRDMLIDARGVVIEVEEEVALGSLPAQVQAEVKKSLGRAQLVKLEGVTKAGKMTGYSALVTAAGKQSEIEMGPDGKLLAKGK